MNTAAPNLPLSRLAPAPAACLAALQGGQARRTARSSKPKYRNRALTARKQRFLTAVHTLELAQLHRGHRQASADLAG